MNPKSIAARRPAESAGVGAGVAGLVYAIAAGNTAAAVIAAAGLVPSAVTWFLVNGGTSGVRELIRNGRRS